MLSNTIFQAENVRLCFFKRGASCHFLLVLMLQFPTFLEWHVAVSRIFLKIFQTFLPDALSPQTTHCSTPMPAWPAAAAAAPAGVLGGDLLVSAEATMQVVDVAKLRAPLESILISCL